MAVTTARHVPLLPLYHGARIPQLGLGTWELDGRDCERAVGRALELGYRHVDTAEAYGNEEAIGRAVAASGVGREEVFITSKVWRDHLRHEDVLSACRGSLRRLGTRYLDLYLVHWPDSSISLQSTITAMDELLAAGSIRAWGVSNFTIPHLEEALELGRPSVDQVELHPRFRQEELDRFCFRNGIGLIAYSPLGHGNVPGDPEIEAIGRPHGKSAAQVALRWSIQKGHVVIPKASGEEHLESNLEVFDFELSEDEMARADALDRGERLLEPGFAEFDR